MDNLDKLTLELFMNKTAYNKYIEKTDPKKHSEYKVFMKKLKQYKERILGITRQYIENKDLRLTLEMDEIFISYAKTCIKYFETKELEQSCCFSKKESGGDDDEDDILFGNIDDPIGGANSDDDYENMDGASVVANI